jgi:hypothetical protein
MPPAPAAASGRNWLRKAIIAAIALVGVIIFLLIIFYIIGASAYKPEAKAGSDYIKAVQEGDYAAIANLTDPELKSIIDRAAKLDNDPSLVNDAYKNYIKGNGDETDIPAKGDAKKKSVDVSNGGGRKHAVVIYKVGSGYVSVLEIYGSDGKPYVLDAESGSKGTTDESFSSTYKDYEAELDNLKSILDQAEQSQSSGTGTESSPLDTSSL